MDIIAGRFPRGRPLRRCREVVLNVARGEFEGGRPPRPDWPMKPVKHKQGSPFGFGVWSSEAHYFCMVFLRKRRKSNPKEAPMMKAKTKCNAIPALRELR